MHRSTIIAVPLALVFVAVLLIPVPHAAEKGQLVTISRALEFAENSQVPDKVKTECWLEPKLPRYIKQFAKKKTNVAFAEDVDNSTEGWMLHIEIGDVIGGSGGSWSGAKWVTVQGRLTDNGEIIGTFIAKRGTSGFGGGPGGHGTCTMLGRCMKTIGKDIAKWLTNPTMDARLGSA